MDIIKEKPFIKNLIAVVKNTMGNPSRRCFVNGRLSDAFVYIISGECAYTFEDGTVVLAQAGDVLYLANQAVYQMKLQTEEYRFIYVDFMFDDERKRQSALYKNAQIGDTVSLFKKLYGEYHSGKTHSRLSGMRQLYEIFLTLCERSESVYLPRSIKEKMSFCRAHIHANYGDKELSVSVLAHLADMSEVYFRKCFQAVYKISPKKYLTSVRLEQARQRMRYSFLSLEECAFQCGFSSWQYFSRVFKNETGETPAIYRKKRYFEHKD